MEREEDVKKILENKKSLAKKNDKAYEKFRYVYLSKDNPKHLMRRNQRSQRISIYGSTYSYPHRQGGRFSNLNFQSPQGYLMRQIYM